MHRVIAASLIVLTLFFSSASAAGAYCLDGPRAVENGARTPAGNEECEHESCPMHAGRTHHEHTVGGDGAGHAASGGAHIKCCRHGVDAMLGFASFEAAMPRDQATAPPTDYAATLHEAPCRAQSEPSFPIDRPPKV